MIRGICFDIGGTLIRSKGAGFCNQLAKQTGKPLDELLPTIDMVFRTRRMELRKAVDAFCKAIGFAEPWRVEQVLRSSPESVTVYEDVVPALEGLKEQYTLAVISNATPWHIADLSRCGLKSYFKTILHSFEVGVTKPDVRIFSEMEKHLGYGPDELFHVGNTLSDVWGSKQAGWKSGYIRRGGKGDENCEKHADAVLDDLRDLIRITVRF